VRLLLDTHIWIWNYTEPHRLSSEVAREMTAPHNDRFLSPISIWEVVSLIERKRVDLRQDFGQWFARSVEELTLSEAAFDWKVAHELPFIKLGHRDPADRLLVATAKAYDLTLVTADQRLMDVPGLSVLANS
jgi:PIN domain nuclease of toxin-antitoxin system